MNFDLLLRDSKFKDDIGIVNLHPTKRAPSVEYINENCFDSHGYSPLEFLSKSNLNRNGICLFSQYQFLGKRYFLCNLLFIYVILKNSFKNRL